MLQPILRTGQENRPIGSANELVVLTKVSQSKV